MYSNGRRGEESLRFRPHPAAKQTEKHIDEQSPEGTRLNKQLLFFKVIETVWRNRNSAPFVFWLKVNRSSKHSKTSTKLQCHIVTPSCFKTKKRIFAPNLSDPTDPRSFCVDRVFWDLRPPYWQLSGAMVHGKPIANRESVRWLPKLIKQRNPNVSFHDEIVRFPV